MLEAEKGEVALRLADLVLSSFYDHSRERIRDVLATFVTAPGIEVERRDVILESLHLMAEAGVDFVDAYLAVRAERAGEMVCTFDSSDSDRLPGSWSRPGSV